MKLYYSAGSCSTSCHISLEESGLPYQATEVDWDNAADPNISLITKLNPMGTLPVMTNAGGKTLSQNIAIHTFIADQAAEKNLLPKAGTPERAEAMNWLSFVASDLHKTFSILFALEGMTPDKTAQASVRTFALNGLKTCFTTLDAQLAGKDYILGKNFSVVDAYGFVVSGWSKYLDVPMDSYKNVNAWLGRVYQRPAVQKVMKEEGLLQ